MRAGKRKLDSMADRSSLPGKWKMDITPVGVTPTSGGDMVVWKTTRSNHEDRRPTSCEDVLAGVDESDPDFNLSGNVDQIMRRGDTGSGSRTLIKSEIFAAASVDRIVLAAGHIIACELWEETSRTVNRGRTNDKGFKEQRMRPLLPLPFKLSGLTEISFPELEVGFNRGQVICGVLSVRAYLGWEPSNTPVIHSVLEDDGGRALKIMIFNTVMRFSCPVQVIQDFYREGTKLAIRNPVLKVVRNEDLALHVWDPSDIYFVRDFLSESGETVSFDKVQLRHKETLETASCSLSSQLSTNDRASSRFVTTDRLLHVGESLYQHRDWEGALAIYSSLISQTNQRLKVCRLFESQKEERAEVVNFVRAVALEKIRLGHLIFHAFSKRCDIWMHIRCYEMALLDAEIAWLMECSPKESLVRKGLALRGLARYEEAAKNFTSASYINPRNQQEVEAIEICYAALKQSRDGTYYLAGMLLPAPPFGEFVGAVEIQSVWNFGRGLFLTKAAVAGEILIVSNAVALTSNGVSSPSIEDVYEDLVARIAMRARYSSRLRAQLYSLGHTTLGEQFESLDNKDSGLSLAVPPRSLFLSESQRGETREASDVTSPAGLNVSNLDPAVASKERTDFQKIVSSNAIGESEEYEVVIGKSKFKQSSAWGLWMLPSFINHSCTPNCNRKRVGDAMFITSEKDMTPGEELTIPYFDIRQSFKLRQAAAKVLGFTCLCRLCNDENCYLPLP